MGTMATILGDCGYMSSNCSFAPTGPNDWRSTMELSAGASEISVTQNPTPSQHVPRIDDRYIGRFEGGRVA